MAKLCVTTEQVRWHRLRANNLADRLAAGELAAAAFAGLQDSAPRAGLTSLHARVHEVGSQDWEHPSLVQTWAPRGAVFVVPRADLGVFARGILPRDPDLRRTLDEIARRARAAAHGSPSEGDATAALGTIPESLARHMRGHPVARLAFAVAGIRVRWDARTTRLLADSLPEEEPELARRELARRFLRSLGPAGPAQFARWAAVGAADAKASFAAIADELVEIRWPGGAGSLLAADAERLATAQPVRGIRLLAFGGDPVLQPGESLMSADPAHRRAALARWACTGLVLLDGEIVASWGRSDGRISLCALRALGRDDADRIEREATGMPAAGRMRVAWSYR